MKNKQSANEPDRGISDIGANSAVDDARWRAVLRRDRDYDGQFVYAVTSTGIFCRPSCAARRPRRENVRFFNDAGAAQAAEFRPCRRCRPTTAKPVDAAAERARQACRLIEAQADSPPSLTDLGRQLRTDPTHLQRSFKQRTGISPRQYADAVRMAKLKRGLRQGVGVLAAQAEAGYGSSRALYERAGQQLGMTPATYGRGGKDVDIAYTITACPLGHLLVAATDKGLCSVMLGDNENALAAALAAEYPRAARTRDAGRLTAWVQTIVRHLEGREPHIDLPVDVRATAFQRQVWQALQAIPYGQTRSYAEVAAALGNRSAVRAVARACATNPVALAIPCHRVVGSDGSLTGYRWGVERKRKLIAKEREVAGKE